MGKNADEYRKLFPQQKIPLILDHLLEAGETLRIKTPYDFEDRLTTRLCYKLVRFPIFRDGPLGIHPQQDILSSDPDADTPSGRIDILVSCGRGFHVYFAIEAKRLRIVSRKGKSIAGNSDYVNEGMMRFITGQYATFMESGAMLGYVFDGDIKKARSGINQYITNKIEELKLKSPGRLIRSSILLNKRIDETSHDLSKRSFKLYHIFLAVNSP